MIVKDILFKRFSRKVRIFFTLKMFFIYRITMKKK